MGDFPNSRDTTRGVAQERAREGRQSEKRRRHVREKVAKGPRKRPECLMGFPDPSVPWFDNMKGDRGMGGALNG